MVQLTKIDTIIDYQRLLWVAYSSYLSSYQSYHSDFDCCCRVDNIILLQHLLARWHAQLKHSRNPNGRSSTISINHILKQREHPQGKTHATPMLTPTHLNTPVVDVGRPSQDAMPGNGGH